jgi:hypothetical protein
VDRENSLSAVISSPSHLPSSFDPRCEDRSFSPDILQLYVQCTDGECSLCPLRVTASALHRNVLQWGALCKITPSHRQCSPMYGLAMGSASYQREWAMGRASHVEERSMGSAPYVHSLSPRVIFIVVAWDGERSLSKGPGNWECYPCAGWGDGEQSLYSVPLAGSALHQSPGRSISVPMGHPRTRQFWTSYFI